MTLRKALWLVAIVCVSVPAAAQRIPQYRGFVNDFANVIDERDEIAITQVAQVVREATGAEIAVATVPTLSGFATIEELSLAMATAWGVGARGEDNGVLVVVAIQERRTRIEVGYGLEGALPDGMVGRIMDRSMVPYFRDNDFGTGLRKAVEGIAGIIADEYDVDLQGVSTAESEKYSRDESSPIPNITPLIVFAIIFLAGGGRFLFPMIFLGGMRRGGFGRGGFGSSSRGGFGGFGGGSFGGGGASRGF